MSILKYNNEKYHRKMEVGLDALGEMINTTMTLIDMFIKEKKNDKKLVAIVMKSMRRKLQDKEKIKESEGQAHNTNAPSQQMLHCHQIAKPPDATPPRKPSKLQDQCLRPLTTTSLAFCLLAAGSG